MKKFTKRIAGGCKKIPLGAGAVKASAAAMIAVIVTVASRFKVYAIDTLPSLDLPDVTTGFIGDILTWIFISMGVVGLGIAGFGGFNFFIALATKDAMQKTDSLKWMLAGGGIIILGGAIAMAI